MITQVNNGNRDKYEALYARAMKDLSDQKGINTQINSLETYFANIEQLLTLSKAGTENYGRTYTILPLDEQYFEINTNTRTISVPKVFHDNGIAVQGDMGAEIIYFKVPRYFDAMDLDHTDIYIQWQYTNSQTKKPEQGFSHEWVRDIESEDDYLIFGWALGGRITEEAGTLQFSIRFIKSEKNLDGTLSISYSLSTLTTGVAIKPGLNFNVNNIPVESLEDIIGANYVNTTTNTDSQIDLFQYVWDLDKVAIDNEMPATRPSPSVIECDLNNEGKLKVKLSVYASPINDFKGDFLKYYLYKQTGSQPNINKDTEIKEMDIIYEGTMDKKYQENGLKMYYKDTYNKIKVTEEDFENNNGKDYYVFNTETNKYDSAEGNPYDKNVQYFIFKEKARYFPLDLNNIQLEDVYERYGEIVLDKDKDNDIAGTYYGITKAFINGNKSGPQYTNYQLLIPGPTQLILDNEQIQYASLFLTEDTRPNLSVNFKQKNEKDTITYNWYRINKDGENELMNEHEDTYTPTVTGKYYAEIIATRNFTELEPIKTENFIVTLLPKTPSLSIDTESYYAPGAPIEFEAIDNNDTSIIDSKLEYALAKVIRMPDGSFGYENLDISDKPYFTIETNGGNSYVCRVRSIYNGRESKYINTNAFGIV